jgi:hypothetical protein
VFNEPGSRLEFGTLIAYILPGYIVEFCVFSALDLLNMFFGSGASVLSRLLTLGAAGAAILVGGSGLLAYFLGLIMDICAHRVFGDEETELKYETYRDAVGRLRCLIKVRDLYDFVDFVSTNPSKSDVVEKIDEKKQRDCEVLIDALFYRVATAEIWARQNWSWSFYEASRQLSFLLTPLTFFVGLYSSFLLFGLFKQPYDGLALIISLLAAISLAVLVWRFPRKLVGEYHETLCKSYYYKRAYVVLAYFIERGLLFDEHHLRIGLDRPVI